MTNLFVFFAIPLFPCALVAKRDNEGQEDAKTGRNTKVVQIKFYQSNYNSAS